jgi:hypothetical protein
LPINELNNKNLPIYLSPFIKTQTRSPTDKSAAWVVESTSPLNFADVTGL